MGISRIAFLFDIKEFKNIITPLIVSIENKDYSYLRSISTQKAQNDPNIWKILDSLGYFQNDLGKEEEEFDTEDGRVLFWVNILIAASCDSTPIFPVTAREIGETLVSLNANEKTITKLQIGRSFCELFFDQEHLEKRPFWCERLPAGWLGLEDIKILLDDIKGIQSQLIDPVSSQDEIKENILILNRIHEMLIKAIEKNKGLLLGVSI